MSRRITQGRKLQQSRVILDWVSPPMPERLTWLKSQILAALDLEGQPRTRRLFISRRDSTKRRIVNEDEIARALEGCGFQTVVLSRRPDEAFRIG
jgi:capsular polysaccharide biosynthesis protein